MRRLFLSLLLLCVGFAAHAGTRCTQSAISPQQLAAAAESAQRVIAELEREDRPLALLARHGTDLSKQGLHYSHVGFVVRDHPDGRWRVVHLLNQCGTDRGGLYVQGLVNFFADDLITQDFRLVWPEPALSAALLETLSDARITQLFDPDYNLIAHPRSKRTQNSTAWVLDVLMGAQLPPPQRFQRRNTQALQQAQGFQPDRVHIPYHQRVLGALFGANVDFGGHSVATRLDGDYPVVTVRSILRYLQERGAILKQSEFRDGRFHARPGPA